MKRLIPLLALIAPSAQAAPQRVISLNPCTDQYVLALADPAQIAGLSRHAANPQMSAAAQQARPYRRFGTNAEEVLAAKPDLVLGLPFGSSPAAVALAGQHYPTLDLPPATSFADIVAQTRQVGAALGKAQRAEALVAGMERDLASVPHGRTGLVAAYYQRRGFLTGTGTLVDDMMARAGMENLARRLNKPVLARLSVEELVAARPDVIIMESANRHVRDQGTELLHHPALRAIPRLYLPEAWTVCGGPAYGLAVRSLVAQGKGLRPARRK